jgi:DNA-binding MarR family transcriptional regulator
MSVSKSSGQQEGTAGNARFHPDDLDRFLRFSHIFSSAVREILEEKFVREVSPGPLTRAQFRLLKLIALDGDPQVGEVASSLGVSAAATCKNLDTLERLGLVQRCNSPHDRRATLLSVSSKGRRVVRDYERLTSKRVAPVLGDLGQERVDQLCDLLEAVSVELLRREFKGEGTCLRCASYYQNDCPVQDIHGGCPSHAIRGE